MCRPTTKSEPAWLRRLPTAFILIGLITRMIHPVSAQSSSSSVSSSGIKKAVFKFKPRSFDFDLVSRSLLKSHPAVQEDFSVGVTPPLTYSIDESSFPADTSAVARNLKRKKKKKKKKKPMKTSNDEITHVISMDTFAPSTSAPSDYPTTESPTVENSIHPSTSPSTAPSTAPNTAHSATPSSTTTPPSLYPTTESPTVNGKVENSVKPSTAPSTTPSATTTPPSHYPTTASPTGNGKVENSVHPSTTPSIAATTDDPTTESPTLNGNENSAHPSSSTTPSSTIVDCRAIGNHTMGFVEKANWTALDFLYMVEKTTSSSTSMRIEDVQVLLEEKLLKTVASELLSCGRRLTVVVVGNQTQTEFGQSQDLKRLNVSALDSSPPDILQKEGEIGKSIYLLFFLPGRHHILYFYCPFVTHRSDTSFCFSSSYRTIVSCPVVTSEHSCYLFEGKMRFVSNGITSGNQEEEEFAFYQAIQNAMENGALLDNSSFPEVLGVSYVNDPSDLQDKNTVVFVAPSSAKKSMNSTAERSMILGVLFASVCGTVLLLLVALKIRQSSIGSKDNVDDDSAKEEQNMEGIEESLSGVDQFIDTGSISNTLDFRSFDDTATYDGIQSINTVSDIPPSLTHVEDSILRFAHTLTCGFANVFK
jgi:hypothetical protein